MVKGIELRKLVEMKNFPYNPKEVCISPRDWQLPYGLYVKALKEAEKMAENCNDICVAIVHDPNIGCQYILAEAAPGTWEPKIVLFNAEKVEEEEGEVRVIVNSKVSGGRVYEAWIKYAPGKMA